MAFRLARRYSKETRNYSTLIFSKNNFHFQRNLLLEKKCIISQPKFQFSTFSLTSSSSPPPHTTLVKTSHYTYRRFVFVVVVRHQSEVILERFGKFKRRLEPGLHFVIPMVDNLKSELSLKEEAIPIPNQTAITNDNVYLMVDGVLYVKIVDSTKAYYGIANLEYAITQLAQTTMRSELGKITLDKTFAEREALNERIVESINKASESWGIQSLRYEIRDISPPASVKLAMDLQAEAERKKRAAILTSEGDRQANINHAEGKKQAAILAARGEAQATIVRAKATARGIRAVARAIQREGGKDAVSLRVAEQYVNAWGNLAKKGTTILLPSDPSNPANMIAQAFGIYKNVLKQGEPSKDTEQKDESLGDDYYPKFDEDFSTTSSSEVDEEQDQEKHEKKDKEPLSKDSLPDQSKPLPL